MLRGKRSLRHNRRLEVRFRTLGKASVERIGFTTNVSSTGMFVATSRPLRTKTEVDVEVMVGSDTCVVRAFVARSARYPAVLQSFKPSGMGLLFAGREPRLMELLRLCDEDAAGAKAPAPKMSGTSSPASDKIEERSASIGRRPANVTPEATSRRPADISTEVSIPQAMEPSPKPEARRKELRELELARATLVRQLEHEKARRAELETRADDLKTEAARFRVSLRKAEQEGTRAAEQALATQSTLTDQLEDERAKRAELETRADDLKTEAARFRVSLRQAEEESTRAAHKAIATQVTLTEQLGDEKAKRAELETRADDLKTEAARLRVSLRQAGEESTRAADQAAATQVTLTEQLENASPTAALLQQRVRSLSGRVEKRSSFRFSGLSAGLGLVLGLAFASFWPRTSTEPAPAQSTVAAVSPSGQPEDRSLDRRRPGAAAENSRTAESDGAEQLARSTVLAPAAPADPDRSLAEAAVQQWAAAWSEQRVDDYLTAYSPEFVPSSGQSREDWAQDRRARVLRPKEIRVTLGPLTLETSGDRARARFRQSYVADTYRDEVDKTLELLWKEDRWRIVEESSSPVAP